MKSGHKIDRQELRIRKLVQFLRLCEEQSIPLEKARKRLVGLGLSKDLIDAASASLESTGRRERRTSAERKRAGKAASAEGELELKTLSDFTMALAGQPSEREPLLQDFGHPNVFGELENGEDGADPRLFDGDLISRAPLFKSERVRKAVRAFPILVTFIVVGWAAFNIPASTKPHLRNSQTSREALTVAPVREKASDQPLQERPGRKGRRGSSRGEFRALSGSSSSEGSGAGHALWSNDRRDRP